MAEVYSGRPLFPGSGTIDQVFKICAVLGSPTKVLYYTLYNHLLIYWGFFVNPFHMQSTSCTMKEYSNDCFVHV